MTQLPKYYIVEAKAPAVCILNVEQAYWNSHNGEHYTGTQAAKPTLITRKQV